MPRLTQFAARIAALGIVGTSMFGLPAVAQVRQYTPPGGAVAELSNRKEALASAVEDARWNAGPVRLDPAFWISDLAWIDSSAPGTESDLTARAGAGLRAYLPVGSKTTFAAFALPEYVWWKERDEERRLNQRFGLGSFTYFNRLSIELTAVRNEDFDYATGETLERITGRNETLGAELEIPILKKFALFASGRQATFESLAEDPDLAERYEDLNREDSAYRGGLRYYPVEELHFGVGVGQSETDFDETARDRSNSGDFWYAEASLMRPKLQVSVHYQDNELEGEPGSRFGAFTGSTGSVRIAWLPRATFGLRLYGSQGLAYALLDEEQTAYVDEIVGIGANLKIGRRLGLDLYTESGTHSYDGELGGNDQVDDVETFGVSLTVTLARRLDLEIGYRKSTISPEGGLPDRELDEIQGSLTFGIGGGSGTWF